jgi:hypothetical protein
MIKLSEEKIEAIRTICKTKEGENLINWEEVYSEYEVPEEFIREFVVNIDWFWVSSCQKLSESFLIEFIDKIIPEYCKNNQKIPQEVVERVLAMKELMNQ